MLGAIVNSPVYRAWGDVMGMPVYGSWFKFGMNYFIRMDVNATSSHELLEFLQGLSRVPCKHSILVVDMKKHVVGGSTAIDFRALAGWTVELLDGSPVFVRPANYPS